MAALPDRQQGRTWRRAGIRGALVGVAMLLVSVVGAANARAGTPVSAGDTTPLVIGETFVLVSQAVGETRRINVYRPSAWNVPADQPLPVLYMPDGGIGEDFLHVAGLVQVLVANGSMRPFLLVGIENTERRRDMTGPTSDPDDRRIAPRVGGSAAFRHFLRDELMPQVRRRYATTPETAIMGESLAGLFVVETLLREPALFDTYIALDPSLWWNRGGLVDEAEALLALHAPHGKTVFVATSAERGIAVPSARFMEALTAHAPGVRRRYAALPNESHQTLYHPAALLALRSLFTPVAAAP